MEMLNYIWKLELRHEYFRNGSCQEITITPTGETYSWLRRRGYFWRRAGMSEWSLLSMGRLLPEQGDRLEVIVSVTDPRFHYQTDEWEASIPKEYLLPGSMGAHPRELCRLNLAPADGNWANGPYTTEITFRAARKYWEYILIPRDGNQARQLELDEAEKKIAFTAPESFLFMERKVLRCRSLEKIPSCEWYDYSLRLSEVLPVGRRLLMRQVSVPQPGMFADMPTDTMRHLLYF